MKRMRRGIIVCAVLAALALSVWLALPQAAPPEPVYQGRPLSFWVDALGFPSGTSAADFTNAPVAIQQMGTNAVPFLVARLKSDVLWGPRKARFNALATRLHIPWRFEVHRTDIQNFRAVQAFLFIGERATPGLLKVFEDSSSTNVLNPAAQALCFCNSGSDGVAVPQPRVSGWSQFVTDQKAHMSPRAWKRLTNATVTVKFMGD